MRRSTRIRLILATLAVAAGAAVFYQLVESGPAPETISRTPSLPSAESTYTEPTPATPGALPAPLEPVPDPTVPDTLFPAAPDTMIPEDPVSPALPDPGPGELALYPSGQLQIPVQGVRPDQLQDTYNDARSEGRVHNAIDIMAPHGTPVVAVANGSIVKLFNSERGGITIYQLDTTGRMVYYYAHLDRYADGLAEGQKVNRGQVIGYVGDTGNAGAGNYHLHFSISIIPDPKHYWDGINVNPYPLLRGEK